jgi:ABC-type transport system involved in multi-copper enzyme maturation permease subunit
MSARRLRAVFAMEFHQGMTRPLFWILVVILALTSYGLSSGNMRIMSGDSSVGGTKVWITSMYAVSQMLSMVVLLFYAFFVAIGAGMTVIRDDELKVGELLHATPLTPGEYVWGRFAGSALTFLVALALQMLFMIVCAYVLPHPGKEEIFGTFGLSHYLMPALVFAVPTILFFAGVAFAVGVFSRKPILVFMFPLATLVVVALFLWNWSPSWLPLGWNRLLMALDPAGFRWLNETWLKVDRGVAFYNTAPVRYDALFAINRLLCLICAFAGVVAAHGRFAAMLRGRVPARGARARRRARRESAAAAPAHSETGGAAEPAAVPVLRRPLAELGMRVRPLGFLRGVWAVLRVELRELRSQPGLYLFVPIILIQVLGTALTAQGAFSTPMLNTPGTLAVRCMNTLTLLIVFLVLFYTVESLERERNTGFGSIFHASPLRTGSILLGKILANAAVGFVVVLATFVACVIALLVQGRVAFELGPFVLVWVVILAPTIVVWAALTAAIWTVTRNRFTTYGVALALLCLTGYLQSIGKMNWVGNWDLWSALRWSDMGSFELDRTAIVLNRIEVLALAAAFLALAAKLFPRRDTDPLQRLARLRPGALLRGAASVVPGLAIALVTGGLLAHDVNAGFEGGAAKKLAKDYWRKNVATYKDCPLPSVSHVDLAVNLEPSRRELSSRGTLHLVNRLDEPIERVPLTGGRHWRDVEWTVNGEPARPEDRSRLYVFTPPEPLAPGDTIAIGFKFHGRYPEGITKNGGGTEEFILPSGVVLTSFRPTMLPLPGFQTDVGVDKDNSSDSKEYLDDFYLGQTKSAFGVDRPFTTHVEVTGPVGYTLNSVGTLVSDTPAGDRHTAVWVSDRPVTFLNVVAGRWSTHEGEGTRIFYHAAHGANIAEMGEALDAARKYYSEWFLPFPWRELKLSEFPDLARYAQGFPTDITFSEGIGFLTKSDPKADLAFMVTAHESAHQWWGNILNPGEGPGGDILSEGMAHFSTVLLFDQVKGERGRMEFLKRIEEDYANDRQADSERPLVKTDGSKTGDRVVTYDKGGWVFWMLLNHLGRERDLAGVSDFIRTYADNPDHPVLQDFVAVLRKQAADTTAYDAFVRQWFFEKVLPEYRISDARRVQIAADAATAARADATAGAADSTASASHSTAGSWEVTASVENAGTGLMPVEVAATAGKRFDTAGKPDSTYHDARATVSLGAGEKKRVTIRCSFKPERLVVDPDVMVLQLERKRAEVKL